MREACVNPACYRWGTSLVDFIAASANAGFSTVEVSIQQASSLADDLGGLTELRRWKRRAGVTVAQFSGLIPAGPVLPAPLLIGESEFCGTLPTLDHRLTVAESLECPRAAIVVNPRTDLSRQEATDRALTRLRLLATRAAEHGVRLAVEFIGVGRDLDHSLDGSQPFVRDLAGLRKLLDQADHSNIGILVDLCHVYASGASLSELATLQDRVEFVQVCDIPRGVPPAALTDAARCLPGHGMLDYREVSATLDTAGYHGPLSIELFSPELWQLNPSAAARNLFASSRALVATSTHKGAH